MCISVYLSDAGMKERGYSLSLGMYKVRSGRGSFTYLCLMPSRRAVGAQSAVLGNRLLLLPKCTGKRRTWCKKRVVCSVQPSHSRQGGGLLGPWCRCRQLPPLPGTVSSGTRAGVVRKLSCHRWRASALISWSGVDIWIDFQSPLVQGRWISRPMPSSRSIPSPGHQGFCRSI